MTIYRMYAANGDRSGFWVQHREWRNMCARVVSIGGKTIGRLAGSAPSYESAEVLVRGYDIRSGREIDMGPRLERPEDKNYSFIAEPAWFISLDQAVTSPIVSG